jgi:hypothetical protein
MAEATNPLRVRRIELRLGLQDEGYPTVSRDPPPSKLTIALEVEAGTDLTNRHGVKPASFRSPTLDDRISEPRGVRKAAEISLGCCQQNRVQASPKSVTEHRV